LAAEAQAKDRDAVADLVEEPGRPREVALAVRGAGAGSEDDAVDMREDVVLERVPAERVRARISFIS